MRMLLTERAALRRSAAGIGACAALLCVLFGACKRQDDSQPSAVSTATAYPGYPPPQGTYAQPYPAQYPAPTATYGQYSPPAQPAAPAAPAPPPAPAPAPTAAPPVASSQMAVPGPLAFQCQNDVPCGTHHCNVQYGKCAFPCQSAADCISPAQCVAGLCIFTMTPAH